MAELSVSVVSADGQVWAGAATMVVARTTDGEIGILPGHEPVLAILGDGQVRAILPGETQTVTIDAADGFLSVEHDTVMIVARNAELAG